MPIDFLPTTTPQTESEVKDIIGLCKGRFDSSRRFDRDFKLQCLNDWYYLNSILPDGWDRRFYTRMFHPETQQAARASVEQVMSAVFPRDNFFDLWGNDGQNDIQVELMREKMKSELLRSQYKINAYLWAMEAINYGNGVICTHAEPQWTEKRVTRPLIDPRFGVQIGVEKITEKKIESRIRMRVASRFDLFPYPGYYNDVQAMPFFIVREYIPYSVFKERAKWRGWKNSDKVEGWMFSGRYSRDNDDTETDNLYSRLEATGYGVTGADHGVDSIKFVELWHYYEAPPGGTGCRAYAVIADGKHLMCARSREYDHALKPIADLLWAPVDSQLWQSVGVPRLIRPYQDQINVREAQYSDLMEFYRNPQRIVGPSAGISPLTKLLPFPGQIIKSTGNIQDMKVLEMPPPPPGMLQLSDRAQVGIQRTTLSDMRGVVGTGSANDATNTTASGKQIYTDNQAKAAAFQTLFQEERGVAIQLQQFAGICQQFATQDFETINMRDKNDILQRAGMVEGNQVKFQPEMISGEYTFRAVGSVRAMEGAERAQMMQNFWANVFSDPQLANKYSKHMVVKQTHEMLFHRPISIYEKSPQEMEDDSKIPKPLAPPMLPKFKDLKEYPQAAAAALQRAGLPNQDAPPMTRAQELQAKIAAEQQGIEARTTADTLAHIVKAHAAPAKIQPKFLPQRAEPQNV